MWAIDIASIVCHSELVEGLSIKLYEMFRQAQHDKLIDKNVYRKSF